MMLFQSHRVINMAAALIVLACISILISACSATSPGLTPNPNEGQNKNPVIHYLTVPRQLQPNQETQIICMATVENIDVLSYEWSASGGEIKKKEDNVIWKAPAAIGEYTIKVTVINSKSEKAIKTASILVTREPPQYPEVLSVKCINCPNGIEASRFKEYELRCEAMDPNQSELSYTWISSLGKIKGDGAYANLYTVGQYGSALITIIVTNKKGYKAEGYLAINISCCH